jgi:alpha-1,3-fucosyltransferase
MKTQLTVFVLFLMSVSFIYLTMSRTTKINLIPKKLIWVSEIFNQVEENSTLDKFICIRTSPNHYYAEINGTKYPKSIALHMNKSIDFDCLKQNSKQPKLILTWTKYFDDPSFDGALNAESNCPMLNYCELTSDRSRYNQSDIVVFHIRDKVEGELPPFHHRPAHQRWLFLVYESPIHSSTLSSFYAEFGAAFNLTSTYRIDSDFPGEYESMSGMEWCRNETFEPLFDFYEGKRKFAAAIVSNCGASSGRDGYVREMRRYVSVDVFGNCGDLKCPAENKEQKVKLHPLFNCKEFISRDYKFYLSFENSLCEDYITEKFFLVLRLNIVLVVLGGGNYEHYVSVLMIKKKNKNSF